MQPDCNQPNPLASVPHPHGAAPRGLASHHLRPHHIVGRIHRHGTARHLAMRHAASKVGGCNRVVVPLLRSPGAAILTKLAQVAAGGIGVIGGFGVIGGHSLVAATLPGGSPACVGATCEPHTAVSEPISFVLLGFAALLVMMLRSRCVRKA